MAYILLMLWLLFIRYRGVEVTDYWGQLPGRVNLIPFSSIGSMLRTLWYNPYPAVLWTVVYNIGGNIIMFVTSIPLKGEVMVRTLPLAPPQGRKGPLEKVLNILSCPLRGAIPIATRGPLGEGSPTFPCYYILPSLVEGQGGGSIL